MSKLDGSTGETEEGDFSASSPAKAEVADEQCRSASTSQVDQGPSQGPLRGTKVSVDGKEFTVGAETVEELQRDPKKTAPPEMVAPFLAARNRLTMLAAREKSGKSTFAGWIASRVSCGGTLGGLVFPPRRVLWCGLEEDENDAVRRFIDMKANLRNIAIVPSLGPNPIPQLKAELAAFQPEFCLIDSFTALATNSVDDENAATQVNKFLNTLRVVVRDSNAGFTLLHHATKHDDGYRGSTGIGASMDMILGMSTPKDCPTERVVQALGRFKLPSYRIRFDSDAMTYTVVGNATSGPAQAPKKPEKNERIVAYLREHPGSGIKVLRSVIGGRAQDVDAAVETLVGQGKILHLGERRGFCLRDVP